MKLKTIDHDGQTYALVQDGKPVYEDDGKEIAFDVEGTRATISRLNAEAKSHREAKEAAISQLSSFEGLDADAAKDALDKLSKIDAKKLVEAGDMDAAIKAAVKPYEDKLSLAEKTASDLQSSLGKEMIGNRFAQSKFANEKLTPAGRDLIRTMYGDKLAIEGNTVIGHDANGQKLYSKANPGEPAGFDEIIESFVETYPYKDHILKGNDNHGGGGKPNAGVSGSKTITRAQFDALTPADKMANAKAGIKVVDAA